MSQPQQKRQERLGRIFCSWVHLSASCVYGWVSGSNFSVVDGRRTKSQISIGRLGQQVVNLSNQLTSKFGLLDGSCASFDSSA